MARLDFRAGTTILGYRIESTLGRGGMSVVYLAEDVRLRRRVALKVLDPHLADDERFRERFLRESEIAASIDHPHVIPIYDAGESEDGVLYIAMRYVEGTDLKALLRREGPLEPMRALAIAKQVAEALDAAHAHGLVHRDVKPANVLIADRGEGEHAYLSDFGLTKSGSLTSGLTAAGQFLGTIDYVAPEQIRGDPVDGRTDLYALGCLLFECLTGEVPFHRDAEVAVIYAHLQEKPPAASTRRPGLPVQLDAVLASAMAKKPGERQASCREFVSAAEAALHGGVRIRSGRRLVFLGASAAVLVAGLVTGLLLALDSGSDAGRSRGALSPVRYGVSLSEQLSTGAAGAQPDLTLFAVFDDGRGSLHGLGSGPPPQTGELSFRIDRRQFQPDQGPSGVYDLLGSPAGTRIGYLSASPGGADLIQDPLRKIGVSRNPKTGEWTVRLAQSVSPAFRRLTGRPYLPVIVRIGSRELVFAFNFQKLASHAAAIGSAFSFSWVSLHLFGSYARLGQQAQAARNPLVRTTLHASVAARPCSDPTCETLGPSVHDSALIVLPRELTVLAPGRAFYGQPVRFYGTGEPGEFVTIAYEHRPGSAPPCTTANFQSPPDCAPRFRPALRKLTEQRTRVAVDGTWSLMLPLRSSTPVPGPLQLPEERSVSGRYVAVEYSGRHIWGPWPPVGGSFSVVAEAPRETVVALDRPVIELARRGRRDVVTVSVRGADRFVRVVVSFRGAVVAAGAMNDNGVFTATFAAPLRRGAVEAQVSTEGAIPSTASREAPVARA